MTSNIGQEILLADDVSDETGQISELTKQEVSERLKHYYPPEFLNRLDEVLIFNRLSKESLRNILEVRLGEIGDRLLDKRISLKLTDEAKELLCELGYDPVYGARPLNRVLHKKLLNSLAMLMIKGQIKENEDVRVNVKNGEVYVEPNHEEKLIKY